VHVLETVGPQEYELKPASLAERAAVSYGDQAAADITAHLAA
jgi:adenosine kinase